MSDVLPVIAESRIAPAVFAGVLAAVNSPAAPDAAALYEIPLSWGLDPAVALAFFRHESRCGTQGVAVRTRNWGNLRKGQGNHLRNAEGWAWYATWADGLRDWCTLIATVYVPRGHTTVETIVPVYAPSSDGNVPAAYVGAVRADVARWQAQSAAIADPWAGWGAAVLAPVQLQVQGTSGTAQPRCAPALSRTAHAGLEAGGFERLGGGAPRWPRPGAPAGTEP
jgi:hypothetical protein